MICEICGKRKATRTISIEGAKVEVCNHCSGSIETEIKKEQKPKTYTLYRPVNNIKNILEEYMKSNSISLKDLSNRTKISEIDIKAIIDGRLIDKEKIRRLEKITGKTLIEKITIVDTPDQHKADDKIKLEEFIDGERS